MAENIDHTAAVQRVVGSNDTTIFSDRDHGDEAVPAYIDANLDAFAAAGVKHLYLEHDASDSSVKQLKEGYAGQPYATMMEHAERLGIQIHLYDDRSEERAVDARYPEAAAYKRSHDKYARDPEALIAQSPNPEEMRAYLAANHAAAISPRRNEGIVNNISRELDAHPGERSLVVMGAWHTKNVNDVDEGLRANGHQVTTVEPPLSYTNTADRGKDSPDFIVSTKPGNPVFYKKNPDDVSLTRLTTESTDVPWRNAEPLGSSEKPTIGNNIDTPNPFADALRGFDCNSFAATVNTNGVHYNNAYTPPAGQCRISQPEESLGLRL